jgi:hypothetical protein
MANNNMAFILIAAGAAVIGATILLKPKEDEDEDEDKGDMWQELRDQVALGKTPPTDTGQVEVIRRTVQKPTWDWKPEPMKDEHNQVWIS